MELVATEADGELSRRQAEAVLESRPTAPCIAPRADLPADTRLWAALQAASGGTWAGCVYDPDAIIAALRSGGVTASASAGTSSAA